jgi:predicted nuclease with RNAse H fold
MKIAIGIDVGAPARGFHAVALKRGAYHDKLSSPDSRTIASWCERIGAHAIGVDAPCRWSATGRARRAERDLMAKGIWIFSTPSMEIAVSHPTGYFNWMLNGAKLFSELSSGFPLFSGATGSRHPICFETFPHAIACSLAGKIVRAKHKRTIRRALLEQNGIDTTQLTNIDWVDAALCALTAHRLLAGTVNTHGDLGEGFIIVPD